MKHNWQYKKLGEIGEIITGSTPDTSIKEYYNSSDFMFVKPGDINENTITQLKTTESYVSAFAFNKCCRKLPTNSILVTCIGTLGKVGILAKEATCNQQINAIIPNNCSAKFLAYAILSIRSELISKKNGPVVPIINKSRFSNFPIPLPPLEEQQRIVAELDRINAVMEDCRQLLRTLDALAQSLFYDSFGDLTQTVPLSYYVESLSGGKSLAGKEPCINKVLKSGAVSYDYFDKNSTKFLPTNYIPTSDHLVKIGDLLISRMNTAELVGACAYVFEIEANTYLPDRLWRINIKTNVNSIYLWKCLISEESKSQIRAKASGTSGSMKNISKPLLLSIMIKKAPLELQQQFARRIEAIEAQKKAVEKTIATLQTLLDSRMDYWFN